MSCQVLLRVVKSCLELTGVVLGCQELSRIVKSCQELSRVVKGCQELLRVVVNCFIETLRSYYNIETFGEVGRIWMTLGHDMIIGVEC